MELILAGESTLEKADSDLSIPKSLMNENPTNGKSSPENPAGFNWRIEDKPHEFFSGSSKFEVSSSDLRVGMKGGGAGGKKSTKKGQNSATVHSATVPLIQ